MLTLATEIFFLRSAYLVSVSTEEWIFCRRVLHCNDDLPWKWKSRKCRYLPEAQKYFCVLLYCNAQSTHTVYLEYHSVCPLVRMGPSLPPPPPQYPLPQASVSLPPEPKRDTHSPAGEGVGGPNSDDCRKKPSTLSSLWCCVFIDLVVQWFLDQGK